MSTPNIEFVMKELLEKALSPTFLQIEDESPAHAGHAGAKGGASHFKITIDSALFVDKTPIACHRMVYAALGNLVGNEVHAVRIEVGRRSEGV